MCGILALISKNVLKDGYRLWFDKAFSKIDRRGPDCSIIKSFDDCILGFHRLSIVGYDRISNRILHDHSKTIFLICNGEIYNYQELYDKYKFKAVTHSDCEIILHLYEYYTSHSLPIEDMISELDGVFAFVIWDSIKKEYMICRDRVGVRPLYWVEDNEVVLVASEGKSLLEFPDIKEKYKIKQFPPGCYVTSGKDITNWSKPIPRLHLSLEMTKDILSKYMVRAVEKRLHADRPIGFLLSGGLDSSLVVSIASRLMKVPIHTFSIGFKDSVDLKYARDVADYLGTIHHEVIITENDIENVMEDVIYCLETPMFLLSRYISTNTDIRVIFSGEGSDELFGGYLYFLSAPSYTEFQNETERLVKELHRYDVLRSDRTTAYWGLELRVPFLDFDFVNFVIGTDPQYKFPLNGVEKWLLRSAMSSFLPESITWRQKEAFSDGVGKQSVSFLKELGKQYQGEREMYKKIYTCHGFDTILNITEYWMPKWNDGIDDPSATLLSHHISNQSTL